MLLLYQVALDARELTPLFPRRDLAQAQTLSTFVLILNSTKSSDVSNIVKGLTSQEQDGLMKFVYKVGTDVFSFCEFFVYRGVFR